MTCTGIVTGGKAHRVRVRGPRSKKACCNEKQPASNIKNIHPQTIKVKDIDLLNSRKTRSSSAPPYTHDVDADPHPYDAYINKAGGDEWVLELQRLLEEENMLKVESNRFEVMTWTPLPWPGSPTEELTTVSVDAMSMMDVKADDDTFIAYYNDPRCRHLLCNETCVDIEMGIRW